MKKIIAVLAAVCLGVLAFGQETRPFAEFRGRTTLSAFAGGYAAQQNANNQGKWYGLYAEYLPLRLMFTEYEHLNLGFSGLASHSEYVGNDTRSRYQSESSEFGLGLATGFYTYRLTPNSAFYLGANALLKDQQEIGLGTNAGAEGRYLAKEDNLLFSGEINLNILKTYESGRKDWPRTQLRLMYQQALRSQKDAFWNATPLAESSSWNRTAYMAEWKQSFYRFGKRNHFEPKLVASYHYYAGDKSNWLILGPEFALRKLNWDDYLNLSFLVKKQVGNFAPNLNSTLFMIQVNFAPLNITR